MEKKTKENLFMQETRQNRIARLLQKELAQIFEAETRKTHGVMVSVTRVRISPDLSICTAYLSIFPSDKAEEMVSNINANEKTIRYELGKRVRNQLRIIPELPLLCRCSLATDELLKHSSSILEEEHQHHQYHLLQLQWPQWPWSSS